jgi:hypothetical protein
VTDLVIKRRGRPRFRENGPLPGPVKGLCRDRRRKPPSRTKPAISELAGKSSKGTQYLPLAGGRKFERASQAARDGLVRLVRFLAVIPNKSNISIGEWRKRIKLQQVNKSVMACAQSGLSALAKTGRVGGGTPVMVT